MVHVRDHKRFTEITYKSASIFPDDNGAVLVRQSNPLGQPETLSKSFMELIFILND